MKLKKTVIVILSCFLILILIITISYLKSPGIINCLLVSWSRSFTEVEPNLFISNDTPGAIKDSIISVLNKADKRVKDYWMAAKRNGNPVIIFCYSESLLKDYSGNNFILTYKTPLNSFIVFHKSRIDIDMLSHEMFHTELFARTGYFNNAELPVWFDEGAAMQVDFRKEYSEKRYNEIKDSIDFKLSHISTPPEFYSGNFYHHFIAARHEVSSWISAVGKDGFFRLIERINNGDEFSSAYNEIKPAH